jgi:hypothetical protein
MNDQTHYSVFFCSICTLPVVIESRTMKIDAGTVAHESCLPGAATKPGARTGTRLMTYARMGLSWVSSPHKASR